MEPLIKISLSISVLMYLAGTAGYLLFLFRQKDRVQQGSFYLLCTGAVFHLVHIALQVSASGNIPVHNMQQTLSIGAFALAIVFIYIRQAFKLKILGVFASGLITLIMVAVILMPETPPDQSEILKSFWLWFHVILVFSGEAALALACGTGILYLLQENAIKTKKQGFFFRRLPSLDLLDSTSYTCITTGFTLLTFGLVTGFIYAKIALGRFWGWDQKEIWSVVTWLFYAVLLHCRLYSGWQGRKSAVMTIIGFGLLVFTFLGVNLLLGGYHQVFTR